MARNARAATTHGPHIGDPEHGPYPASVSASDMDAGDPYRALHDAPAASPHHEQINEKRHYSINRGQLVRHNTVADAMM